LPRYSWPPKNFTDLTADFLTGKSYRFSISTITCNKPYPLLLTSAWIDFDASGDWSEEERVLPATNHFGAIFFDVTIPADAKVGPTSMRAMVQETSVGQQTIQPCDNFKYGGTQDYPLQIRNN